MTVSDALAAEMRGEIDDLLEEVSSKNHVRVAVFRAVRGERSGYTIRKKISDELADPSVAMGPALVLADSVRMLAGKAPIYIREAYRRLGGELVCVAPNLRTDVGKDFVANSLGGTQPSQADYIALSNNNGGASASHTSNTVPWNTAETTDAASSGTRGEYTTYASSSMARKQATYAHTVNTTSYTQSATWTAGNTVTTVQLAGLFGGAAKTAQGTGATNILFLENTFTATTLATNDQLSLTWTVNV